jgi:DNA-binding NtrC family response regulator
VLCLDTDANVLAYLRELLRAGYDVHTSSHLRDAMLLMRITHFDVVLAGPDIPASPARAAGLSSGLCQAASD